MRAWFLAAILWCCSLVAQADSSSWRTAPDTHRIAEAMMAPPPPVPPDWEEHQNIYASIVAAPADHATALHLSRTTARELPRIAEEMGLPIGEQIHIYLAPTQQDFFDLQPGQPPSWADGTAYPHRGLIFLRSPTVRGGMAQPLEQVLEHELAHILLGRAFGNRPVPRWLQEGVAQLVAREYTMDMTDRLGAGMLGGQLLSLDELSAGFPSDPLRAQLAYAQSADFVAFLLQEYGQQALHDIIHQMAGGATFAASIRSATGMSVDHLDAQWRTGLEESSMLWLRPLVSDTTLLSVSGMVFLVLGGLALRRRRQQIQEMDDDEPILEEWYENQRRTLSYTENHAAFHHPTPRLPETTWPVSPAHVSIHGPH